MEVWQIAESPYAPKFQVIAKPNDWAKAVKRAATEGELSETKILQFEFWSKFREFVQEKGGNIKLASKGDIFEQDQWLNYHSWMFAKVIAFQDVFSHYIKTVG